MKQCWDHDVHVCRVWMYGWMKAFGYDGYMNDWTETGLKFEEFDSTNKETASVCTIPRQQSAHFMSTDNLL